MNELSDMRISGSGTIPGGEFNNVKIAGSGKITGNVKANLISISGSGSSEGNLISNSIKISGSFKCNGTVNATEVIKVAGSGNFLKLVEGKDITISGSASFGGKVKFENMTIAGSSIIKDNCEGKNFRSNGKLEISTLLSADMISISPYENCYVKEIGGEKITVIPEKVNSISFKSLFYSFSSDKPGILSSDIIEGDKIYLENTKCKIVRGHDIEIGPKCDIEKIEYTGTLSLNEKSTVGEKVCTKK